MDDGLRVQARRPRAEKLDDLLAKPRAAAGRRDDKRAGKIQPRRLVADARQRTGGKDDALRRNVVREG